MVGTIEGEGWGKNMKKQDNQAGGGTTEWESNERDILVEGDIVAKFRLELSSNTHSSRVLRLQHSAACAFHLSTALLSSLIFCEPCEKENIVGQIFDLRTIIS
ncbi:hypothetical protein STEG23_025563, partial [Scotinomys teguina]